ncbi:hypothetical protein [Streptomyces sp. NPDC006510]|uniref:hypothetical protein n=1 Tax=Streptomyces sp. NPDC006510 TaxID=3155600 RepID=UPI0033A7263E
MGLVPVEVLLVDDEAPVHDQQGVGSRLGRALRERAGPTAWSREREAVEGAGRRGRQHGGAA